MADRTREASKEPRPTTVLDPLRPAVVVRRRVYDAAMLEKAADTPRAFTSDPARASTEEDDDESGPPSSINVARALASLRSDELRRVEELVRADEEDEEDEELEESAPSTARVDSQVAAPASSPTKPTLTLSKTIPLSELARRMGVSAQELPAALVARGFYALDAKTVLPRQTARVIAELYGWKVEDAPAELDEPEEQTMRDSAPPTKRAEAARRSRIATKRKVGTKAKAKPKVKAKPKSSSAAKHAKRRLAR